MTMHIGTGELKVMQELGASGSSPSEVGRVVVLGTGTTAEEHWYLYTSVDTTANPEAGLYRVPSSAHPSEVFTLLPASTSPFDPDDFDAARYGEALREAGVEYTYIRCDCAKPEPFDGVHLPSEGSPGAPSGPPREDGQIYLNVAGSYYEVWQETTLAGYLIVSAASSGSGYASVEDWRLYGSYATPDGSSGGGYRLQHRVGGLPRGVAYHQVVASCTELPPAP